MKIFGILALFFLIGSPILAFCFAAMLHKEDSDSDEYVGGAMISLFLALVCGIIWKTSTADDPITIYDAEIRMHYVDGYSKIVREDSISADGLPHISEGFVKHHSYPPGCGSRERTGTYSLYFGGKRYHGVIRYEYLHKRKYQVSPQVYRKIRRHG